MNLEDVAEFTRGVVGETDVSVEARLESGIGVYKALHLVGVSCDDDDEFVAIVFHSFEKGGDGFLTVVLLYACIRQRG